MIKLFVSSTSVNVQVGMTTTGWPENGTGVAAGRDTILDTECVTLWGLVMQNPPSVATDTSGDYQATVVSPTCTFTLVDDTNNFITYKIKIKIKD